MTVPSNKSDLIQNFKSYQKYSIKDHRNEAETQKHQRADDGIRELKHRWKLRVIRRQVPKRVLDYAIVW